MLDSIFSRSTNNLEQKSELDNLVLQFIERQCIVVFTSLIIYHSI